MSEFVTEKDNGYKAFIENMRAIKNKPYVKTGVIGNGQEKQEGSKKKATLVEYATYNEFGTATIPERSFLRSTVFEKQNDLKKLSEFFLKKFTKKEYQVGDALKYIGLFLETAIKKKIGSNLPPPNAVSTMLHKLRKGLTKKGGQDKMDAYKNNFGHLDALPKSSGMPKTLIDTGRLRQSISFQVVEKDAQ